MNTAALLNFYYDEERERRDRMARDSYVREEGEAIGRTKGIAKGMISMGRKIGLSDAAIIDSIAAELNCSQKEASDLFQQDGQ